MKNINKSGKLKIISRMMKTLDHLKSEIIAQHDPIELTDRELKSIAYLYDDVEKFEQLANRTLYERVGNNFPNNKLIQRNIERLLI